MIRTDARSVPTTTNAGQADRAGPSGGANSAVTLKRSNAIRAKPPGLTSSGNPLQRARMLHKRGAVPSSQSSSAAAVGSDGSKAQSPPKPADKQASLLEATPAELQTVAHIPVLQPTVLHSTPSHEGNLIDLSDAPQATRPAHAQPAPFGVAHGSHGAPGTPAFAASGMPSPQQIEHETRQAIEMQRAVGFAKQLLAVAEMVNSFRMKLIDMIRKAVSS